MKLPVAPCLLALGTLAVTVTASDETSRPAEGIQDNSFLVEEAYNQEKGVVQHIFNAQFAYDHQDDDDVRAWLLTFTQEWPIFSQRHQFSYSIPYGFINGPGLNQNGLGDVLLNYRLQALFESDTTPAFAPRFSLILPTSDPDKGIGNDELGYQFNLPVSKVVADRWTLHANAGLTWLPDLRGENSVSYRLAGSAIYAVSRDFNLMLELVGDWVETVDDARNTDYEFLSVISPGVRYAFNWPSSQLVLGVATPIGLNNKTPEIGMFLYASFEHVFARAKAE